MNKAYGGTAAPHGTGSRSVLSLLLWLAVFAGWLVSIFTVIEEMCLATACSDAASFTVFGLNMGWLGIVYFSLLLMLLWRRSRYYRLEWLFAALVFAGIGFELRLLWIQKYIIGSWCPLCVTICCALFVTGIVLMAEKLQEGRSAYGFGKNLVWWAALAAVMAAAGLVIALAGVRALL